MRRGILLVPVLGLCAVIAGSGRSDVPPKGTTEPDKQPGKRDLKLLTKKELMQAKLKHSQTVLEGIALNDFDKVRDAADELLRITRAGDFLNAYKGNEYLFQLDVFKRAAEAVSKKAEGKNMDGVMVAYNSLTLTCLNCHQGMRDKKFDARLPDVGGNDKAAAE
jgi:hypothetical protein